MSAIVDEILYALEDPEVMLPVAMCSSSSKARYRGWQELDAVGMVECPFDPRKTSVCLRWMARFTDHPSAELTHRFCDQMTPGAALYWIVEVEE